MNLQLFLINIYGPTLNIDKKILWEEMSIVIKNHRNKCILIGGDFNTIINLDENFGGVQQSS